MDVGRAFLEEAVANAASYKKQGEAALTQVSDEQFFQSPGPTSNSVAVLVKHMGGNLPSRWRDFLSTDGEKPDRDRDSEFVITKLDTRPSLMALWEEGWATHLAEMRALTSGDLARTITIRGRPLTVLQATLRSLTHSAGHVSQIVYVAKLLAGDAWKTLSIERGKSCEFNRNLGYTAGA